MLLLFRLCRSKILVLLLLRLCRSTIFLYNDLDLSQFSKLNKGFKNIFATGILSLVVKNRFKDDAESYEGV